MTEKQMYDLLDELSERKELGFYIPTLAELEKHDLMKDFDKYAPFLVYISHSIENMDRDLINEQQWRDAKAVQQKINRILLLNVTEDESDCSDLH